MFKPIRDYLVSCALDMSPCGTDKRAQTDGRTDEETGKTVMRLIKTFV